LYKNDKNKQILILDEAISGNIEKNDKDLFKIKKAVLIFESSDENQFFNLLNPSDFKNSPWKILSLEILGDFYLDRGQKNKAKDIYNQALKIENIPEIFKKELEKKTKNLN
jgi:predicted negative regulator of RcsB-dependent stress response